MHTYIHIVAREKINMQKLIAFLYTNNKLAEKKTRKAILFTKIAKIIKYLGINLTKEVEALMKIKNIIKEIEDTKNGKIFHVHGL
jgi:hypothetical protein